MGSLDKAKEFERLRFNYKNGFLVNDTRAFQDFCFANSDALSKLLAKGAARSRRVKKWKAK